ncbi:MAG TPA: hypothetical protein VLH15_08375 [Dehalococcoidales bacterium]|nr:hypothetical protein [Dehalococcoidales bacterium]
MQSSMVDKLMDMCDKHSGSIAEIWYKSLTTNPRTKACNAIPKEVCLRQAADIYKSIADVYFAEDGYKAMGQILDISGFVDTYFARGVPLEQTLYALILLRRHIWLFADAQLIFNPSVADMALAIDSINRILLVFDYATHYVCKTYLELAAKPRQ